MDVDEMAAANIALRELTAMLDRREPGFARELADRLQDGTRIGERADNNVADALDSIAGDLRLISGS